MIIILALFIFLFSPEQTTVPAFRDYEVPFVSTFVQAVNDLWKSMKKDIGITSHSLYQRTKGGVTSSVYGHLTIRCSAGREEKTSFVLSGQPNLQVPLEKEMRAEGLVPVTDIDHAIAFIAQSNAAQKRLTTNIFSMAISACSGKPNGPEAFLAFSLWLTRNERGHDFSIVSVSKEKFEQLK